MRKLKGLLVVLLILALAAAFTTSFTAVYGAEIPKETANIWSPRAHMPAFAEPGQTFEVEVRVSGSLSLTGWTAKLSNDLKTWDADVVEVKAGKVYYGIEDGYIFTIEVPEDITPELLNLTLIDGNGNYMVSNRSVKVEFDLEQDFYILHVTDEHAMRPNAVWTSGQSNNSSATNGSMAMIYWSAPSINIINPRFVLHTGDNIQFYHEWNLHNGIDQPTWSGDLTGPQMLRAYLDAKSTYTVPTIMVGGNHDTGYSNYNDIARWTEIYEDIMGATTFDIRMGSFYFIGTEWTWSRHTNYARDKFQATFSDPTIKFRLWASHYNDANTIHSGEYQFDLGLGGHNHQSRKLQSTPFPFFTSASGQSYQEHTFWKFEKQQDGSWACPQAAQNSMTMGVDRFRMFNMSATGSPTKVASSYKPEEYAVTQEFENENDGTQTENKVTITNNIRQNFFDGRVRFLMDRGVYDVEGGEVVYQYHYGYNKTAVVVKVDIPAATQSASSTVEVEISKVGDAPRDPESEEPAESSEEPAESSEEPAESSEEPAESSEAPSQSSSEAPSQSSEQPGESSSVESEEESQAQSGTTSSTDSTGGGTPKTSDTNMVLFSFVLVLFAGAAAFVMMPKKARNR